MIGTTPVRYEKMSILPRENVKKKKILIINKPSLQEINYDFIKFCLALSSNIVALSCMNLKP